MRGRKGQAAIFMTMTLTVSMGLIGLVVDIGWAYWRKEACATAASAAAFAAISAASGSGVTNQSCGSGLTAWACGTYPCPANPSSVTNNFDNGCLYAKQNGFYDTGHQTVSLKGGTTSRARARSYARLLGNRHRDRADSHAVFSGSRPTLDADLLSIDRCYLQR